MTLAEQTTNLQQFGYSHREASFLVTAALHSGYFRLASLRPRRAKQPISFPGKLLTNQHASAQQFAAQYVPVSPEIQAVLSRHWPGEQPSPARA